MSRWIKLIFSLGITAGCIWWMFRNYQTEDWHKLGVAIQSANWFVLVPYAGLLAIIHIARTLRWGNLMSGLEVVSFKKLNEASAIGFMMLIILPFRLGEFARPFLIAQRSNIRRSSAMTSVVLERIIDGVAIAILLRVLMFFVPGDSEGIQRIRIGANLMFAVFFSGLVFLLIARWQHDRVIGVMRATLGRLSKGLTEQAVHIVDGFVGALKQLPDRRNLLLFVAWTVVYWVTNGVGVTMMANAFDCGGGTVANCQPLHITELQGFVVLCVSIVGMMIPAGPASAGTVQSFYLLALSVFVAPEIVNAGGVAFATVIWVVQVAQQILVGLFFLILSNSSFTDIAGKISAENQPSQT
jgi:uncharacterized protein (TIRG00374 family)